MKSRILRPLITAFFRCVTASTISSVTVAMVGLQAADAADQTWGANAATDWYTAANWAGGAVPGLQGTAAANTDTAIFSSAFGGINPGINLSAASLNLGAIHADNTRATETAIGNSSATAGDLRLYGATVNSVANVILRNAGTGLLTLQGTQSGTMGVVLGNATNHLINLDGAGGITISANIAEAAAGAKLTLGGSGAGTLTLAGTNSYTGVTTISAGRLALGVNNALPASGYVLFTSTPSAATSRTLNLGATTQEIGQLNVTYNPNGAVTHTALVTGAGGSLKVGGVFDLNVTNSSSVTPGATASVVHLDLTGLGTFEYQSPTKKVIVLGNGNARAGTLSLGATNTLTALSLDLQNGGAGSNTAKTSVINLGQTTTLNADTLTVLNNDVRDSATLKFRALTSPTLKIRATDTVGRATWNLGTNIGTNTTTGTASVDLVSGVSGSSSLDAMVGTLTIGQKTGTAILNANFAMGGGTLDATAIALGTLTGSGTLNATLSVTGGTVKVGTLTFGTRTAGTLNATLNLNSGGTLAAQALATSGTATRVLNWNDGTLTTYDTATDLTIPAELTIKLATSGTHTFDIGAGRSAAVAAALSDATTSGSLVKSGAGTLTLSGTNTYTGNTVANAGTFVLPAGSQLKFVLGAASGLSNNITGAGTVMLDGSFNIDLTPAAALTVGSWTLENVASLTGAYGDSFAVAGFTDAGGDTWTKTDGPKVWTFSETTGVLTLVTTAAHLNWSGAVSGNWDLASTPNWRIGAVSAAYAVGDYASFDDTATGTSNVVLNVEVSPLTVTFDNSVKNYTLTGTGLISGLGGLSKAGTGTTTIAIDNTYTGGTTITAGVLEIGNGGTTGALGSGPIDTAGTLVINRADLFTLGAAISGSGSFTQSGTGTSVLAADNSFGGTTTIASGTLQVGNGGATGTLGNSSAIINQGTLAFNRSGTTTLSQDINGSGNLLQSGPGTLIFDYDMTYTGATTINGGTLQLGTNGSVGSVIAARIVNNGTLIINRSDDLNFGKTISGSGSVTHAGSSLLRLTGSNTYTGTTIVGGTGTLLLDSAGSAVPPATGIAFTASGTLDFSDLDLAIKSLAKASGVLATVRANTGKSLTVTGGGNVLVNDGSLSLGGIEQCIYDNTSGDFSTTVVNSGGTATTTLASLSNTITTANFSIGKNGPGGAGTSSNATVNLGATTALNANTITVGSNGAQTGASLLCVDPGISGATIKIRGTDGGSTRANLTVGYKTSSDYAGGSGSVDLTATGATLDALLDVVIIGKHDTGAGNFNNATSGSMVFNTGTLDANSIVMAAATTVNIKTATGTLTTNGGTIRTGTLTLVQDSGGALGTATVNLNPSADLLTQPTLEVTTITGQAAANAVIHLNAGTLANVPGGDLTLTGTTLSLAATAHPSLIVQAGQTATFGSGAVCRFTYNPNTLAHSTLTVTGNLVLNTATAELITSETPAANLPAGSKFVLIDYRTGSLTGEFPNAADGTTVDVGGQAFVIDYNDPAYAGKAVTLTVQAAATPYETWLGSFGITAGGVQTAPPEDYDHDGMTNMVEYVLNSHPGSGTQSHLPAAVKSGTNLVVSFTRLKQAGTDGYSSTIEYSTTLAGAWTTVVPTDIQDQGATEAVTTTIPIHGGATQLFARLKVTSPAP